MQCRTMTSNERNNDVIVVVNPLTDALCFVGKSWLVPIHHHRHHHFYGHLGFLLTPPISFPPFSHTYVHYIHHKRLCKSHPCTAGVSQVSPIEFDLLWLVFLSLLLSLPNPQQRQNP